MNKLVKGLLIFFAFILYGCSDNAGKTEVGLSNTSISASDLRQPIRFSEKNLPGYVRSVSGLDAPEAFGRWSTKKMVIVEFTGPLPAKVNLEITAAAFGPNVGAQARVIIGSDAKTFVVNTDTTAAVTNRLTFENTGGDRFMIIEVPKPISPAELGQGQDLRKLGLALVSIQLAAR